MILVFVIIGIALLSIGISYISLRNDMKKHTHVAEVGKKLAKGRVIFYAPSKSSK